MSPDRTSFGELTGENSARCEEIKGALAAGGVPSTVSDHITEEMWEKFYVFATLATIASLTRATAGEVAATASGAAFVVSVLHECTRVTDAEGYPTPNETKERMRALYARVGLPHRASILDDLEQGRPTEGEHTIGDLVRRADRHGLAVPIMRAALCNLQVHDARGRK